MNIEEIRQVLNSKIKKGNWKLEESPAGKSKTSYIGVLEKDKVFIKVESVNTSLLRLADTNITPQILYADSKIIVQEYISGEQPSTAWLNRNYQEIAKLICKYHSDEKLKAILELETPSEYKETSNRFLREVEKWKKEIDTSSKDESVTKHLDRLIEGKPKAISDETTPIHADPNISNFILKEEKIYIVDWDDVRMSDPLRDIGQFAWDYVPKEKWNTFVSQCGLEFTKEREYRFFWWISMTKLFVGFWFYIYQKDKDTYKKYLAESILVANKYLFSK